MRSDPSSVVSTPEWPPTWDFNGIAALVAVEDMVAESRKHLFDFNLAPKPRS
jgi:hypothetical protein